MSNIIPPLLSNSPPPPPTPDDVDDDEFGDFIGSRDNFYGFESSSSYPASLENSPQKMSIPKDIDINSNLESNEVNQTVLDVNNEDVENLFPNSSEPIPDLFGENFENSPFECDPIEKKINVDFKSDVNVDLENSKNEINAFSNVNDVKQSDESIVHEFKASSEPDKLLTVTSNSEILYLTANDSSENVANQNNSDIEDNAENEIDKSDREGKKDTPSLDKVIDTTNSPSQLSDNVSRSSNELECNNEVVKSNESTAQDDDDDDDDEEFEFKAFGDSNSWEQVDSVELKEPSNSLEYNQDEDDDDFADFADFTTGSGDDVLKQENIPATHGIDDEDDFGDFESSNLDQPIVVAPMEVISEEAAYDKAKKMFIEAFPACETCCDECLIEEIEKNSKLFELLKDITDTPALTLQWPKSSSQKLLLKALNIDERNILPSWSSSATPIFASNLSLQPLEPVKTESPIPVAPSIPAKPEPEDVPSVHFDWNSAGLKNPLEGPSARSSCLEVVYGEKLPKPEPVAKNEKQIDVEVVGKLENLDLSVFDVATEESSRKSSKPENVFNPIEETNYATWLDTFTPNASNGTEMEQSISGNKENDGDNDFGEFIQPPLQDAPVSPTKTITQNDSKRIEEITTEDEFTDFQSSVPVPEKVSLPIMSETLKPVLVYQNLSSANSTQINWPDPGITDEEIRKLEEAFSKPSQEKEQTKIGSKPSTQEQKVELHKLQEIRSKQEINTKTLKQSKLPLQPNPTKKRDDRFKSSTLKSQSSEEEWSDFVSAQKSSSPIHKLATSDKERTSSPDLPLSVFNLGSIQPAKQPIPVITSQGLVQTKLSANRTGGQPALMLAPSTISKQYVSQAYSFNTMADGEDEWGEFVSNTLPRDPTTAVNGYRHHNQLHQRQPWQNNVQQQQQSSWTIFTQGYRGASSSTSSTNSSSDKVEGKSVLSSNALPELDFIAPKSWTVRKK